MALKVIQSYELIPDELICIITKNLTIDPNDKVVERYKNILRLHALKSAINPYKGTIRYGSSWNEKYIPYINRRALLNKIVLEEYIYPDSRKYYWSDDFSPEAYIAFAQAGFISVSEWVSGQQVLLLESRRICNFGFF